LSTTNPTWIDPGSNLGLRGGRPTTNRLSHGTASTVSYWQFILLLFLQGLIFNKASAFTSRRYLQFRLL
jgi:hypothetical protein